MLVLMQGLELEGERKLFQAIVEYDALDVSHSTMRPVVRCRAHGVRRLECGKCSLFCGCARSDGEPLWRRNCVVHTPQLLCDCTRSDGEPQRLRSCVKCNPDAFCEHLTGDGAARMRHNCVVCTPQLLCSCTGSDGEPQRLESCMKCNPDAFCEHGTGDRAARRRYDCWECERGGDAQLKRRVSSLEDDEVAVIEVVKAGIGIGVGTKLLWKERKERDGKSKVYWTRLWKTMAEKGEGGRYRMKKEKFVEEWVAYAAQEFEAAEAKRASEGKGGEKAAKKQKVR
jgi:hypothetical protein